MAGQGDSRPPVEPPSPDAAALSARKVALVRVAVGVPMMLFSLFAVLVAYRATGRALGGVAFWTLLVTLVAGFSVYFLRPLLILLRRS